MRYKIQFKVMARWSLVAEEIGGVWIPKDCSSVNNELTGICQDLTRIVSGSGSQDNRGEHRGYGTVPADFKMHVVAVAFWMLLV